MGDRGVDRIGISETDHSADSGSDGISGVVDRFVWRLCGERESSVPTSPADHPQGARRDGASNASPPALWVRSRAGRLESHQRCSSPAADRTRSRVPSRCSRPAQRARHPRGLGSKSWGGLRDYPGSHLISDDDSGLAPCDPSNSALHHSRRDRDGQRPEQRARQHRGLGTKSWGRLRNHQRCHLTWSDDSFSVEP